MLAATGVHFPGRPPTLVVSTWVSVYRLYLLLIFSRTKIRNGIEKGEADQLAQSPPVEGGVQRAGAVGVACGSGRAEPTGRPQVRVLFREPSDGGRLDSLIQRAHGGTAGQGKEVTPRGAASAHGAPACSWPRGSHATAAEQGG